MSMLKLDQHPTLLLGALRRLRRKVEGFNIKGRLSGKEASRQWGGDCLTWFLNVVSHILPTHWSVSCGLLSDCLLPVGEVTALPGM